MVKQLSLVVLFLINKTMAGRFYTQAQMREIRQLDNKFNSKPGPHNIPLEILASYTQVQDYSRPARRRGKPHTINPNTIKRKRLPKKSRS